MCNLYSITKSQAAMIEIARALRDVSGKEVAAIHPKAMPVILRSPDELERWMVAPVEDAFRLQKPLPDGSVMIVAKSSKKDGSVE